jgi:hypothetical protein
VCRTAAGVCDAAENCPGTPGGACPADQKEPNGTVCRAAVNACDVAETCNGSSNTCPADAKQPDGTSCSDGLFCNGAETCASGACTPGTPPCNMVQTCSEGLDECLSTACPSAPLTCRTALKSLLLIKNNTSNDNKDKLTWKFIKGAATTQMDLADPTATANYALCIYSGPSNALVGQMSLPASNTKWHVLGSKGYKFLDLSLADDGAQKVLVKGGGPGKSKALVKGRGANLPDPLDGGSLSFPVTVQLLNYQTGVCFESSFSSALKNTTTLFKAKH